MCYEFMQKPVNNFIGTRISQGKKLIPRQKDIWHKVYQIPNPARIEVAAVEHKHRDKTANFN